MPTSDLLAPELVNVGDLELTRWGLRFTQPQTELAFRAWHTLQSLGLVRLGGITSGLAWLLILIPFRIAAPKEFGTVAAVVGLVLLTIVAAMIVSYRPHRLVWLPSVLVAATSLSGFVVVWGGMSILRREEIATAGTMSCAYFALVIARPRVKHGIAAVLPYLTLLQALLIGSFTSGHITKGDLALYSIFLWGSVQIAFLACIAVDQGSRKSYRQERVIERQRRIIEEERARSERLLLNVLPEPIALRLKTEQRIADYFPEATVLFSDIVGFTPLSQQLQPNALVDVLDEIFSAFDDMAEKHGLEKIKTVGDAYLVVGGVPTPRAGHAEAIADMALEMRELFAARSFAGGQLLSIRIGIHTGPVVAGVIGKKKFVYDLWGDTVNTASRMESQGSPGKVQVTEATWQRLREGFELSERGVVDVKGKGEMRTWFLERRSRIDGSAD